MSSEILKKLYIEDLRLLKPAITGPKRLEMVAYAKSLSGGSLEEPNKHIIWTCGEYSLGFRKPGKETAADFRTNHKDGTVAPNPDDMTPTIWKGDEIIKAPASFEEIFHVFEKLFRNKQDDALEAIAGMLYRSAYLLDYENKEETFLYKIPENLITLLDAPLKDAAGLPADVYLHYLQLIAWNEDVKYNALGFDIAKTKTGRQSNLLTYTYLIAVLLGRMPLANFCYAFARSGGVAPIAGNSTAKSFPWLRAEK